MLLSLKKLAIKLRSWLPGTRRPTRQTTPLRRSTILRLEWLETREVPTVAFLPAFGAETVGGALSSGMQHPTVHLIYSGGYWSTAQGQQDEATLNTAVNTIFNSPYLSGLTQYGSDGKAVFGPLATTGRMVSLTTSGSEPGSADVSSVQTLINQVIADGFAPAGYNDAQHETIYVVVSDSSSSKSFTAGWNFGGNDYAYPGLGNLPIPMPMRMIWLGTAFGSDSHVIKDAFTNTFSHELAETLSGGVTVKPGAKLPMSLQGSSQIGDNEPDHGRYLYRLDGELVQAYWSNRDQAYVVPDGNSQVVTLMPNWNGSSFLGTSNLSVVGDQLSPNYDDTVSINAVNANLQVILNGQSFVFEPQSIFNVTVDTGGGGDVVNVNSLPQAVGTLTIQSETGYDMVNIGTGSLAGIAPWQTISLINFESATSLRIDGVLDSPTNVNVYNNAIVFGGRTIKYETAFFNGQEHGVTSIDIVAPDYSAVYAASVASAITVEVGEYDAVYGPAANQLRVLRRFELPYPPPVGPPAAGGHA